MIAAMMDDRRCFAACPTHVVEAGMCHCHNRAINAIYTQEHGENNSVRPQTGPDGSPDNPKDIRGPRD